MVWVDEMVGAEDEEVARRREIGVANAKGILVTNTPRQSTSPNRVPSTATRPDLGRHHSPSLPNPASVSLAHNEEFVAGSSDRRISLTLPNDVNTNNSGLDASKPKKSRSIHSMMAIGVVDTSTENAQDRGLNMDPEKSITKGGVGGTRYDHTFFSPKISSQRRQYLIVLVRVVLLTILLMWACLPIYWSSLAHSATHTNNLTAWFVNRDVNGELGAALRDAIGNSPKTGRGSLGWVELSLEQARSDEDITNGIVREDAWIAVVVSSNASFALDSARRSGDINYDPSNAITVYYATARNEVATSTYLLPITQGLLRSATTMFATRSSQQYFSTVLSQNGITNTTALEAIIRAPQTITPGVGWKEVDLRRYTAPVAQAVTLVGQIYICIFAFIVVMAHTHARASIEPYLKLRSYLALRLLCPFLAYIPLSLSYALINLPFKLPFEAKFQYARGFLLFFVYIYLGMCALGLALEAMITILTPRFVPFFLVLLIIVNVSTAALPPELQPSLFRYGLGFPFWNIEQAVRAIIFNTTDHLGRNAGVLIAWISLSCFTLSGLVWYMRREVRDGNDKRPRPGRR